jgi:hypothetical protein
MGKVHATAVRASYGHERCHIEVGAPAKQDCGSVVFGEHVQTPWDKDLTPSMWTRGHRSASNIPENTVAYERRMLSYHTNTRHPRSAGTALIDLERRQPVALFPDREVNTLTRWLRAHSGGEIIARDRVKAPADGVRRGGPRNGRPTGLDGPAV